jgi:hypothetical protein
VKEKNMGTGELGKWAWIIGLALAVLGGILAAFGTDLGSTIGDVAVLLAFLGGLLHLASGDRTAFFIAAIALAAFSGAAGVLFVAILGDLVAGILGGAAVAAGAGAAGVLLMTVYEWVMP